MKELLAELQNRLNKQVSIHFYRKEGGVIEKMSDASYTVYLKEIHTGSDMLDLKFTNGMDNAGKSSFTVTFPNSAHAVKESTTTWNVEYEKDDMTYIVKMLFPEDLKVTPSSTSSKQEVTEIKNANGKLEKLIIETPDNGVDLRFLENVEKILNQILQSWKKFTIETVDHTTAQNQEVYEYQEIESLQLPGNTFFEIRALKNSDVESIEVATSLSIDLSASAISFVIDEVPFTLRKHA